MNKKMSLLSVLVLSFALILGTGGPLGAKDLIKLSTAWMPEHEVFFPWYAKEKGWDKEEGLDLELLYFESGMDILEALPAKQWVFGGIGGVPTPWAPCATALTTSASATMSLF
jgi:ABC-type nitrate/sulfonate/bicarbonate transport system substrate-binding protein